MFRNVGVNLNLEQVLNQLRQQPQALPMHQARIAQEVAHLVDTYVPLLDRVGMLMPLSNEFKRRGLEAIHLGYQSLLTRTYGMTPAPFPPFVEIQDPCLVRGPDRADGREMREICSLSIYHDPIPAEAECVPAHCFSLQFRFTETAIRGNDPTIGAKIQHFEGSILNQARVLAEYNERRNRP